MGKEYKTKWTEVKIGKDGSVFESKTWTSDEVPVRTVKSRSKASGNGDFRR